MAAIFTLHGWWRTS
ncbi:trp operon leader peptide [Salmonella enterica]|nr:trp operon leader peptide [Salmonella enterica]